jgi:7-cyano-7-deazaguanine synthase
LGRGGERVKGKAVVLLSGGIDSSTTLAVAKSEGLALYAVSFDYGQRHKRELYSADAVAKSLGVKNHLVIKFDLRDIGGSALTADMKVPKEGPKLQITNKKSERVKSGTPSLIPVTYVPARNTIFLSFALAFAEVLRAGDIFIGANAVDYSGYPDCRPEYLRAFEEMANLATKASVEGRFKFRIKAPLLYLSKGDIIRKGNDLGLDYSLTWSCYDPQPASARVRSSRYKSYEPVTPESGLVPCRKCDSCRFREKGFEEAGIPDPLLNPAI